MNSEYIAERLLDVVTETFEGSDSDNLVDENVRNGGHWFTFTFRDRHYEIQVVEVTRR